jgi:hypothetical protein
MIQPVLNGVEATLANNVPIGNQVSDYKTITIPNLDLDEVMVFTTTTTSDNGRLNNFVNLPLGAEIIKEYWI